MYIYLYSVVNESEAGGGNRRNVVKRNRREFPGVYGWGRILGRKPEVFDLDGTYHMSVYFQ